MSADPPVRERFIPIRKVDLVDSLSNGRMVASNDREAFLRFSTILDSIFHFEFHAKTETLKDNYYPFNPDNDTVNFHHLSHDARKAHEVRLMAAFKDVLNQGKSYFQACGRKDLNFDPGTMIVKLFKNIPKGDLEMLFPNVQVRMKLKDKLFMGGVAVGGGVTVLLKAGAGLVAMASILWLMTRSVVASGGKLPPLGPEISGMVGGVTALAAIGAFLFKQWNSYKNRKIKFMKTLGDSLYFKNLDNNAGVFYHIIADAEEEEFKEALLGYVFLAGSQAGMTAAALDDAIERWFRATYHSPIDFEIEDALGKLKRLKLCEITGNAETGEPIWAAVSLTEACERLDFLWDNFFKMHSPHV